MLRLPPGAHEGVSEGSMNNPRNQPSRMRKRLYVALAWIVFWCTSPAHSQDQLARATIDFAHLESPIAFKRVEGVAAVRSTPAILGTMALGCLAAVPESSPSRLAAEHGVALVARQIDAVLSARWRDGEIRTEYIAATRETEMSLGLLPSSQHGTLTLVLSARLQHRVPAEPPGTLQVRVGAGLNVNPNVIRRPVFRFVLDPSTQRTTTIDASERLRFLDPEPGTTIDNASATISLVEFIQLLRAEVITGQIFGLDVSLTPKQREALRAFGNRVLRPSP